MSMRYISMRLEWPAGRPRGYPLIPDGARAEIRDPITGEHYAIRVEIWRHPSYRVTSWRVRVWHGRDRVLTDSGDAPNAVTAWQRFESAVRTACGAHHDSIYPDAAPAYHPPGSPDPHRYPRDSDRGPRIPDPEPDFDDDRLPRPSSPPPKNSRFAWELVRRTLGQASAMWQADATPRGQCLAWAQRRRRNGTRIPVVTVETEDGERCEFAACPRTEAWRQAEAWIDAGA